MATAMRTGRSLAQTAIREGDIESYLAGFEVSLTGTTDHVIIYPEAASLGIADAGLILLRREDGQAGQ